MFAPEVFGRAVVVLPDGEPPEPWTGAPDVVVSRAAVADDLAGLVERLHRAWVGREPVVIRLELSNAELAMPQSTTEPPWVLGGDFTFLRERLHHLVWANSYDARVDPPRWWWGVKAEAVGAKEGGSRDVVLPGGAEAWIDGGPREPLDVEGAVVHAETVSLGRLDPIPPWLDPWTDGLAPDQREAVRHRGGAARIIAPAGSGKTRTLTARLRHLLDDRRVEPELVTAVAYNRRAARDLAERVGRGNVRTIHSLGRQILHDARGELELLSEQDVRRILDPMVQVVRRPNTDVVGPFVEALSAVRIGLRSPDDVEASRDDVPGFGQLFGAYRARLADRRAADQDEYVFGAVEALLADPDLRARWQQSGRHLLVDEFQDLTPGYLLLLRLVASPGLDVFGVGDDDQVVYGYAGADPGFLIGFDRLFPGAGHHALEVNYRSPAPVVEAVTKLLSYTERRVEKVIRAGTDLGADADGALDVRLVDGDATARVAAEVVTGWLGEGRAPSSMAVLCRVNSALLPVHAVLVDGEVGIRSPIGPPVLERTVLSAALAWLRVALDPDRIRRADLMAIVRRPSRGLNRAAAQVIGRRQAFDLDGLRALGRAFDGRQRSRWDELCSDVELLAAAASGDDARAVVAALIDDVGLSSAAAALDAGRSRADRAGQSDDLRALVRLADVHPRLSDFESWLRSVVAQRDDPDGVLLTTVHRVKGLEWDRVVVFGADAGLMPHALSDDVDEERRVFHVAVTRGRERVVVLADRSRPSRFLAEMEGRAPRTPSARPARQEGRRTSAPTQGGVSVAVGDEIGIAGGYRGVVSRQLPIGILADLVPGPGKVSVRWGERVSVGDRSGPLRPGAVEADPGMVDRLKAWRSETARRQGVPAYVVCSDATLVELAARRPRSEMELLSVKGIGPAKLEAYGDDLLALVADG